MKEAKEQENERRLLSQKQAATYLGISYWTIRDLIFSGEIPFVPITRKKKMVDMMDLDAYINRKKNRFGS